MPKRRTLVCVALATVAIGVAVFLCLPRTPRFTEEQFERIHNGMTKAEVEAVLGCPPENYSGDKYLLILLEVESGPRRLAAASNCEWAADKPDWKWGQSEQAALGIRTWFDGDGRVIGKQQLNYIYKWPTLLERLRAWVGW
jgi:hypothetical protein